MNTQQIEAISQKVWGQKPLKITRKTIGICNQVYELDFGDTAYILRMNMHKSLLYGTHKFLPLFKELGIKTPEIIAEDYSQTTFPFCYQILTKLPGQDLKLVIEDLNPEELKQVAGEVANIFKQFRSRPPQDDFGGLNGLDEESIPNMLAVVQMQRAGIWEKNQKFQVLLPKSFDRLDELIADFRDYFLAVQPILYYDDLSAKNIMIHEGKFSGLVDLDFMRKGDYIEVLGAIRAVWYGEAFEKIYQEELIKLLELNETQQKVINLYAIIHLMMWTTEAGNSFNGNSSAEIDWSEVHKKRDKILALYQEIKGTNQTKA